MEWLAEDFTQTKWQACIMTQNPLIFTSEVMIINNKKHHDIVQFLDFHRVTQVGYF